MIKPCERSGTMEIPNRAKVIIICGPTATGKTSFAVELAQYLGGEIVSADSMQVYRHMDIGTAKPTEEEQGGIPHHIIDVADPDEDFNAATYRRLAIDAVNDITARKRACLVVGGTGLYIKGLTEGLFDCPAAEPEVRERLQKKWDLEGPEKIFETLITIDPEYAAGIHRNDRMRILRGLEIFELTGSKPSELARVHGFSDRPFQTISLCLEMERERLYNRIDRRSEFMVESGLLEETEGLLKKGYSPDLKSMKAIGYKHMVNHIEGKWGLKEAVGFLKRDTRRYAKRQTTWFRGQRDVSWISSDDINPALKRIKAFLREDLK